MTDEMMNVRSLVEKSADADYAAPPIHRFARAAMRRRDGRWLRRLGKMPTTSVRRLISPLRKARPLAGSYTT